MSWLTKETRSRVRRIFYETTTCLSSLASSRGITNRIFVSRYQLYLPDKEQLKRELAYAIEAEEGKKRTNKRQAI